MDGARIVLFEDNKELRDMLGLVFELDGHTVAGVAESMDEATDLIAGLEADDFDVAIVDANLLGSPINGEHGDIIARLLRDKFEDIVIIGHSASHAIKGADHMVFKGGGPGALTGIIKSL